MSKPTVIAWKKRYAAAGIAGLEDLPKPGRPAQVDEVAVVLATLEPPPERLGVTHWSSRLLAEHLSGQGTVISNVWVARIWRKWGLQPWRRETFKFSTDPQLEAKVRDVVGLYLAPPEKAVVLSIDWGSPHEVGEKSQIQALDRTAPILPMRPGLPEKATHDYVRHGTTTLFAALEIATGKVTDACYPRHRSDEFLRLLKQVAKAYPRVKLHLVMDVVDNYATHKHPTVQAWLARNPRITMHFTPTSGVVAEHRDLLRNHHPPGHPSRHLHQRQGPHRRDRDLHRRLERTLPTVHLDQDRRPDPREGNQRSKIIVHATTSGAPADLTWQRREAIRPIPGRATVPTARVARRAGGLSPVRGSSVRAAGGVVVVLRETQPAKNVVQSRTTEGHGGDVAPIQALVGIEDKHAWLVEPGQFAVLDRGGDEKTPLSGGLLCHAVRHGQPLQMPGLDQFGTALGRLHAHRNHASDPGRADLIETPLDLAELLATHRAMQATEEQNQREPAVNP